MGYSPRRKLLSIQSCGALFLFIVLCFMANIMHVSRVLHEIGVVEEVLATSIIQSTKQQVPGIKKTVQLARSELAGLECSAYGGPSPQDAEEMVYWKDIPQDNKHVSPFRKPNRDEYMTFEPDHGGFNNIRMSMETVLALSFATGRTLVLPPSSPMYLLDKGKDHKGKKQQNAFGFQDFFHMEAIASEHVGLDVISMQTYLEKEAGNFRYSDDTVAWPPGNRTAWDGQSLPEMQKLYKWLRIVSHMTVWDPNQCQAAFPASTSHEDVQSLVRTDKELLANPPRWEDYIGKPVPLNGTLLERMSEHRAGRKKLCLYNETMQKAERLHFPADHKIPGARLLTHFYTFLFFQDYHQDLWLKRFARDHVRYNNEIQCAAARVVHAVRQKAPIFHSFHIRRGDFQFKETRLSGKELLDKALTRIAPNSTIYIATDERDKTFFAPMAKVYNLLFLDDFKRELGDVNSNYFGMIDQLIASRGRTFFGCWFSTFTGYINRIRGYHANKAELPGHELGIVPETWYYALNDRYDHMQTYYPVKKEFYAREFPPSWRLLEFGMPQFHEKMQLSTELSKEAY